MHSLLYPCRDIDPSSQDFIALIIQAVGGGIAADAKTVADQNSVSINPLARSLRHVHSLYAIGRSHHARRYCFPARYVSLLGQQQHPLIKSTVALLFFIALATEFYIRFFKNWPLRQADALVTATNASPFTLKLRLQSGGLAFSSVVILIRYVKMSCTIHLSTLTQNLHFRSIYRTIELSDGWSGRIITTQVYFSACCPR